MRYLFVTGLLLVLLQPVSGLRAAEAEASPALPTLGTIRQVLELSPAQAARKYPVLVEGVVTYGYYPAKGPWMMFVQDETAGIFVAGAGQKVEPGQRISLRGYSDPGEFAPRVRRTLVKILGPAPLPRAELMRFEDLVGGQQDCQWVEVKGIVRAAQLFPERGNQLVLSLACGSGRLVAKILVEEARDFSHLVDADVRIRGVCTALFNKRRQLLGIEIYSKGERHLSIEAPGIAAPFDITESPINNLMQFSRNGRAGHRVKVSGVVTFHEAGRFLYIRGDKGALFVQTADQSPVSIGDRVEVLGFPASGDFSAVLEDATYRVIGQEGAPVPRRVTLGRALEGQHDADLIEVEGQLLEHGRMLQQEILTVQAGNLVFTALMNEQEFAKDALRVGSKLRLTGICAMPPGSQLAQPKSFRLLLRSPADVLEIEKPSWWTWSHMLQVMAVAIAIAVIAFGWVVVVSRQNKFLREHRRVQHEILQISVREQRRIGQDLHDGICQQLGAIAFLTKMLEEDLAAGSPQHAGMARDISKHLAETIGQTRAVAKGLFPVQLEENGLESALEEFALHTSRLFKVNCRFHCNEVVRIGDNDVALNLYYVAYEAVSNAVRHGRPRNIWIDLERRQEALVLTIRNDGDRFAPLKDAGPGMGLHIMKYRADRIGASFEVASDEEIACVVTCALHLQPIPA